MLGTRIVTVAVTVLAMAMAAAGCAGDITGPQDDDPAGADAAVPETPTLAFVSPPADSVHTRTTLDGFGALVAAVPLGVEATGAIARVELFDGETALGQATAPDFTLVAEYRGDGARAIRAEGYDAEGALLATAEVTFSVAAPEAADCHAWLDLYGLAYELGPSEQGVPDPVTVTTPINGIVHRYVEYETPRSSFFMDCSLALSLARAAPYLRERSVVEMVDIGVYNYRCIGGGVPPDCENGISQHAYAKAIDIAGFTDAAGTYYSVNDDWVIDDEPTCGAGTEGEKDAFLHEIICAMKEEDVWNIVLTPNYNAAHRNHFHVDLTPGSDYIEHVLPGRLPRATLAAAGASSATASACDMH
jgi:hypothetical protein